MPALHFVLPGDPETRSGGFIYDRRIIEGLQRSGWTVEPHALADEFPQPSARALAEAEQSLAALPDGAPVVIDGLALGVMPEIAHRHARRLVLVGLVHHPLADETGLTPAQEDALFRSERDALSAVRHMIVSSPHTAARLADFDVERGRISVAEPGVDPAPLAEGSRGPGLGLFCAASLTPRKGHAVLIEALARLQHRAWRLICAGSKTRDDATAQRVQKLSRDLGIDGRIDFVGEVEGTELNRHYRCSDLFVLASFHEGYGMVITEAIARGLPVVATAAGAVPDTLPEGAGILVPPGDPEALAAALARLIDAPDELARLKEAARTARAHLPTWEQSVARFAEGLHRALAS